MDFLMISVFNSPISFTVLTVTGELDDTGKRKRLVLPVL